MADINGLLKLTPHDWLYVITYKTGGAGEMFFVRKNKGNILRGYQIDFLLINPSMVINHEGSLEDLYITNNNVAEARVATDDEKAHIKTTLLEAIGLSMRRSTGPVLMYDQNAKTFIEKLPIELPTP